MASKAMIQHLDSLNPDARPFTLTPLALEDLAGEPVFNLTPTGRAEVVAAHAVPITELLRQRLEEFRAARIAREKARGKELLPALDAEEKAALLLAWTLDQAES